MFVYLIIFVIFHQVATGCWVEWYQHDSINMVRIHWFWNNWNSLWSVFWFSFFWFLMIFVLASPLCCMLSLVTMLLHLTVHCFQWTKHRCFLEEKCSYIFATTPLGLCLRLLYGFYTKKRGKWLLFGIFFFNWWNFVWSFTEFPLMIHRVLTSYIF